MSITLRPYQCDAIDGIYQYFSRKAGNPLVVIPTAGGKSLIMASFIEGAIKRYPDQRILCLTHVRELIEQNFGELMRLWPQAPAGIYSAGLNRRDIRARILFAGIQSIHRRVCDVQHCDLVLIDEAHLIGRHSSSMYASFLAGLKRVNPLLKVIGFTATPYRLDCGLLHKGDGALFTDIAYEISVRELIDAGYLSSLVTRRMATTLDVSGVGTRGGEFIPKDLEAAIDTEAITTAAVAEIVDHGQDRLSWLVFCAGVKHAWHVRDAIRAQGYRCETIVGETPSDEREAIIKAFKAGDIRCLTNANVLTTGFNAPGVDLLAMLRPTKSTGLYVQIVGRGCRLAPEKVDCLVLDFAGNIARHGPIDVVKPKGPKSVGQGDAPLKVCPACASEVHPAVRVCPDCGFVFAPPELKIAPRASVLRVLSSGQPNWLAVTRVSYACHQKSGKPPSLRVDYWCGITAYCEWVCLEHGGYARQKALSWWARRVPGVAAPASVAAALALAHSPASPIRTPKAIAVRPSGKYTEVVDARFI